jgi:hypothetical protein
MPKKVRTAKQAVEEVMVLVEELAEDMPLARQTRFLEDLIEAVEAELGEEEESESSEDEAPESEEPETP